MEIKPTHPLIVGDFNHKEIGWDSLSTEMGPNHPASLFLETIRDLFSFQHIKQPTRYREGNQPSVLDLVLTNEIDMIECDDITILPGIGKSDHVTVLFKFKCYSEQKATNRIPNRNYHKGNYIGLCEDLSQVNWDQLDNVDSLDEAWNVFVEKLLDPIGKHIPVNNAFIAKSKRPLDRTTLQAVKKKYQTWTKYLHCKTPDNYERYRSARNNATACIV